MLLSELILTQKRTTKGKVYSLSAPEVECIAKGKAHKPYAFGVKVSLAVTLREGFVVGIQACPGNPYDGHTLDGQLDQVEWLTGKVPAYTFVDKRHKGHGIPEARSRVLISGTRKLGYSLKRHLIPTSFQKGSNIQSRPVRRLGASGFDSILLRPSAPTSVTASRESNTQFPNAFSRSSSHTCSSGLRSGQYGGSGPSSIDSGITSSFDLCHPAPSRTARM